MLLFQHPDFAFDRQRGLGRRERVRDEGADPLALNVRDPISAGLARHGCETVLPLSRPLRSERFPESLAKKRPFVNGRRGGRSNAPVVTEALVEEA